MRLSCDTLVIVGDNQSELRQFVSMQPIGDVAYLAQHIVSVHFLGRFRPERDLRHGPRAWNVWRDQNPSQVPDLDDVRLSLGERQLGPINGGPINLHSASMRGAFLRSATLRGQILRPRICREPTLPTHA
jgi:hypothetical protein